MLRDLHISNSFSAPITSRVSLKFDHEYVRPSESKNLDAISSKLKEICQNTASGVQLNTPRMYTELVYLMKNADVKTLRKVMEIVSDGSICSDNQARTKYVISAKI